MAIIIDVGVQFEDSNNTVHANKIFLLIIVCLLFCSGLTTFGDSDTFAGSRLSAAICCYLAQLDGQMSFALLPFT